MYSCPGLRGGFSQFLLSLGDDDQDGKKKTESVVPPECSHDLSCTCCLDDSLIFVHTEDNALLSFMFLSFPRCLFILKNGLCSQSIMNYLVFSFAAAQKLLSEMKVPAVIALNSTLLLSWSSAASPDGCPEPTERIAGWFRAATLTDVENS